MKDKDKSRARLMLLCRVGVLAALVFAASGLRIVIPVGDGNTALHLGNVLCLLSGLLLGPVPGGLAAGIGSAIYDLTNPLYVASAPFTLAFKFLLAAVAGWVAYSGSRRGRSLGWDLVGSAAGSVTYTLLYVGKSFLSNLWFKGMPFQAAALAALPKLAASAVNGMIAVAAAAPLALAINAALRRAGWEWGKS